MAYLRKEDYYHLIQLSNLNQLTNNDDKLLDRCEGIATAEINGYLSARFEVAKEMKDVTLWSVTKEYTGGEIVYLDGDTYDSGTTYSVDDIVKQEGNVYICIQSGVDKLSDDTYFTLIGQTETLYYSVYPSPKYNYLTEYSTGDEVFYDGKEYTALKDNQGIKPDDATNGATYWGSGTAYNFTGDLINDSTYWAEGDLRNQQLLMITIDLTLYHIHKRIAPQNIPDLRVKCYDDAIKVLSKWASGDLIPNIELIRPKSSTSGIRTRFGYSVKNENNY